MRTSEILKEAPANYFATIEFAWITTKRAFDGEEILCQKWISEDYHLYPEVWVAVKTIVAEYD